MPSTIQQFFQYFLDAFRRRDAETMSECFALPCVFGHRGRQEVFSDRDALQKHFEDYLARYKGMGLNAERFVIRSLMMLGDDFAVANVAWTLLGAGGKIKAFHTAYNVYRNEGAWSIWAVTQHEEAKESANA